MMSNLSRRAFITRTGALALGFSLPLFSGNAQENTKAVKPENNKVVANNVPPNDEYHNAYIEIHADNSIIFRVPDIEFGQGIYTTAAMLLAEELDVVLSAVRVEAALPNEVYILKGEFTEITWGSGSTQKDWLPLQQAAATLRILLVQAAAQLWNIDVGQCHAKEGHVYGPNDQDVLYGQLLQKVALLTEPKEIILKSPDTYSLIGKSQPRVDTPAKIHGTAIYGADVRLPDQQASIMKIGLILACPVVGGKIVQLEDKQALSVQGVVAVLRLEDAVCVVADHFWSASKGASLLEIEWDFGASATVDTQSIYKQLNSVNDENTIVGYTNSDEKIEVSLKNTSHTYEATYNQPMLAHAALEPLNCTISITDTGCEVWSCTQTPLWTQEKVATLLQKDKSQIKIHNLYVGGSFGRRLDDEYIVQAVKFAKQVSYPLQCLWSREEDFAQDHVRPPYVDKVEVGVDENSLLVAVKHNIIGPSVMARWDKSQLTKEGMDPDLLLGINSLPYQIPHYQLNYTPCEIPAIIPGWWQGNGATRNIFVLESMINKYAVKAKKDPIEYRKLLKPDDRALGVINMVAQQAQWDIAPPKDIGRGFALAHVFGSYIAMVVEAEVTATSIVRLHRVIVAVDCGLAVNPDQIAAQIESGTVFGLGSALYNEVQIQNGQIVQRNFNQYRVLRMNETPQVEVHIVKSNEPPSGVGELGTIVAAPALSHALGSILEKHLYTLPLNTYLI